MTRFVIAFVLAAALIHPVQAQNVASSHLVAEFSFVPGALDLPFRPTLRVRVFERGGRLRAELTETPGTAASDPSVRHAETDEDRCPKLRPQIDLLRKLPVQKGQVSTPYPDSSFGGVTLYENGGGRAPAIDEMADKVWTGDTFALLDPCWRDLTTPRT